MILSTFKVYLKQKKQEEEELFAAAREDPEHTIEPSGSSHLSDVMYLALHRCATHSLRICLCLANFHCDPWTAIIPRVGHILFCEASQPYQAWAFSLHRDSCTRRFAIKVVGHPMFDRQVGSTCMFTCSGSLST